MIELIVHGASGRMGSRICARAEQDERVTVVARSTRRVSAVAPLEQQKTPSCHVVIDFSSDAGVLRAIELAERAGAALLVGTTGLSEATKHRLEEVATKRAVMVAANTSRGVVVMRRLLKHAVEALGASYQIDLVEHHHSAKLDAPSGTALCLQDDINASREGALVDERIHSIRAGDLVGEHTVQFAGPGERLQITHEAISRDVFAAGAVDAAVFLAAQGPGLHPFEAVLG